MFFQQQQRMYNQQQQQQQQQRSKPVANQYPMVNPTNHYQQSYTNQQYSQQLRAQHQQTQQLRSQHQQSQQQSSQQQQQPQIYGNPGINWPQMLQGQNYGMSYLFLVLEFSHKFSFSY